MLRSRCAPLVALVLCACVEETTPRSTNVTVVDSAGIEIVSNGDVGSLGELRLSETLRLGVVDAEGPEQFSDIRAVALGPDGHIIVGNNGSVTARVFAPDGSFVVEVGGRGDGPAETSAVNDVLALRDTLVIIDWQRGGRAVAFSLAGGFAKDWGFLQGDGTRALPVFHGPMGWLAQVYAVGRPPPLAPGESFQHTGSVHRMDLSTGSIREKLYEAPATVLYGVDGAEGGVDWALLPETWHTGFDAEARFYVTDHREYRIDVYGPEGLRRSVRKAYEPRPFTPQDVDDIIEASVHTIDTMTAIPVRMRPRQVEQIRRRTEAQARLPRPESVPPLGGLLVSRDGSFWVERWDVHPPTYAATRRTFGFGAQAPAMETAWELFDASGVYRGRVMLPARFRAEAVDDLSVVGVWFDELDVEHVVRYAVTPVVDP